VGAASTGGGANSFELGLTNRQFWVKGVFKTLVQFSKRNCEGVQNHSG
jgi:hypothetical protein